MRQHISHALSKSALLISEHLLNNFTYIVPTLVSNRLLALLPLHSLTAFPLSTIPNFYESFLFHFPTIFNFHPTKFTFFLLLPPSNTSLTISYIILSPFDPCFGNLPSQLWLIYLTFVSLSTLNMKAQILNSTLTHPHPTVKKETHNSRNNLLQIF